LNTTGESTYYVNKYILYRLHSNSHDRYLLEMPYLGVTRG